jgi:hypothetical protein
VAIAQVASSRQLSALVCDWHCVLLTAQLIPGAKVFLLEIPPGFLTDLPIEDQWAIEAAAKRPLEFVGYDDDGRAELEFTNSAGVHHFIYVDQVYVRQVEPS